MRSLPCFGERLGGSHLDQFTFLSSIGVPGGIIVGWNSLLFEGKLARQVVLLWGRTNFLGRFKIICHV